MFDCKKESIHYCNFYASITTMMAQKPVIKEEKEFLEIWTKGINLSKRPASKNLIGKVH